MRPFPDVAGVDVEHDVVEARGLRFHVASAGGGDPLVLLHGWPQHWWMWRLVLPDLAARFRCIVPDLRGLGWTDAPPDGYEKRSLAADVVALLDALGLQRVRVMGHDWGAMTAALACVDAPQRVERAVLLDIPPPWSMGSVAGDPRRLLGAAHVPVLASPAGERLVPFLAERILRMSRLDDAAVREYVDALRPPERRRATVGYYRSFALRDLPSLLRSPPAEPDVPVRCLGGAGDPVVRWSGDVELVSGAGHFLPEDRPEAVVEGALDFL